MPATYTYKDVMAEWSFKTTITKTTGTTVHHVYASEPVSPAQVDTWFRDEVFSIGWQYPNASSASVLCREILTEPQDQTRMFFKVTAQYDNVTEVLEDPLGVIGFEYDQESREETFYEDKTPVGDDGPFYARHTNGVPFKELPKRDSDIIVITLTVNVDDEKEFADYVTFLQKVNDADLTLESVVYAPRTVRVAKITLSKVQQAPNLTNFKTLVVTYKVKRDGWDQKYESLGLTAIEDGIDWPIVDASGHPIEEPWPLNEDGTAKATRSDAGFEIVLRPYDAEADLLTSFTA